MCAGETQGPFLDLGLQPPLLSLTLWAALARLYNEGEGLAQDR